MVMDSGDDQPKEDFRMSLEPLAIILLSTIGPIVTLVIFYWIIRLAVRHGVEDAWRRRGKAQAEQEYWDPARP
jgi:hypothetical protein